MNYMVWQGILETYLWDRCPDCNELGEVERKDYLRRPVMVKCPRCYGATMIQNQVFLLEPIETERSK